MPSAVHHARAQSRRSIPPRRRLLVCPIPPPVPSPLQSTILTPPRTVPYTPESSSITACGIPQAYPASKEWASKKVVLFAVPGAFTPGCSVRHLPGYIEHYSDLKSKGVDIVAVVAMNDAWVMSAWSKANGVKDDDIVSFFNVDSG